MNSWPSSCTPGELLAGVVGDAEHGVIVVGQQLERVDLRRLGGRGAQPGEHLVASLTGDCAGDVDPDGVGVEALGDRVDVAAAPGAARRSSRARAAGCPVPARCASSPPSDCENGTARNVSAAGRCARTTTEPLPLGRSHNDDPQAKKKTFEAAGLDRRAALYGQLEGFARKLQIAVAAGIVDRETLDAAGELLDAHIRT
jgi:hypothetical protein